MTSAAAAMAGDSRAVPQRHVQVLQVADCALVGRLLALIEEAESETGVQVAVQVLVGDHPSPTLVIDGVDVATGGPVATAACCRLDLPTHRQVVDALTESSGASANVSPRP